MTRLRRATREEPDLQLETMAASLGLDAFGLAMAIETERGLN
jgi:hypothetical protein